MASWCNGMKKWFRGSELCVFVTCVHILCVKRLAEFWTGKSVSMERGVGRDSSVGIATRYELDGQGN
jgi:hypothetical protein